MTVPAAVLPSLFKRWLLEALAMGAAAGEIYLAAVEAVLVFDIAVLAERRVLLVPATVKVATFISMEVAAILAKAVAILVSPILATFSITFLAELEPAAFVPFVSPAVLDFLFFRAQGLCAFVAFLHFAVAEVFVLLAFLAGEVFLALCHRSTA